MPLTPAVWQEPGLVVGSATTTPIDLTRPLAAGRPTRSILPRQTRRNWRRNRTQNPPYPSRHSVPETGTTSHRAIASVILTTYKAANFSPIELPWALSYPRPYIIILGQDRGRWDGDNMYWVDLLGYAASAAVLATFCMSTMIPLRALALVSNVLFMAYGYFDHLYPVFILHALLFPVNALRLVQFQRLVRDMRETPREDLSIQTLLPYMTRRNFRAGETLVRKGERADRLY